ncbi:hypothetical protein DID88_000583 [Monilinia fructigena]|uniref:TFIIS central domain-containing protein n=1 Tax=Monilinia fructigena TaxID=38457 RepID=A0A395IHY7_9HELO|nr:hypothetical protein DID88_000583 [Monilinia fructigena]
MDQRELTSRVSALQKAINDKEPASNVITIMETLKRDVNATEELLRATKAGMVVAKQRGNANKDIAKTCHRNCLMAKSGSSPQFAATALPHLRPHPAPPVTKAFKGDSSKRRWETDKVDIKRTGVPTRDACIGLMYNGLAFKCEDPPTNIIIKAMAVEQAAFDHYGGESKDYREKLRSLFQNLKQASNTKLRKRELKSEEMKKKDDALELENMKKAQVPMAEKSISDALTCGKCQQKKICGHRWKFS